MCKCMRTSKYQNSFSITDPMLHGKLCFNARTHFYLHAPSLPFPPTSPRYLQPRYRPASTTSILCTWSHVALPQPLILYNTTHKLKLLPPLRMKVSRRNRGRGNQQTAVDHRGNMAATCRWQSFRQPQLKACCCQRPAWTAMHSAKIIVSETTTFHPLERLRGYNEHRGSPPRR